ncbi:hypothetical protein RR46_02562 [Papilio xuthus]|uniref:Uncharacterized protein n=1 Tax=Papilio xuthus TaxID=66420 RepID=A0A194Q2T6_PAPXU|nr:hypothetical protein RR46_02562 [Papilio xuthus]
MGTEVPKTHDSSGGTDSNSDSENSSSSDSSGSDWECTGSKQGSTRKPHFSVTSCDTGLKLKIAAIPPRKVSPKKTLRPLGKKKSEEESKTTNTKEKDVKKKKSQLSDTSSSSEVCSKCSSDSSSEDDLPLKAVKKTLPAKCSPQKSVKSGRNSGVKSDSDGHRHSSDDKDVASKKDAKDKSSAFKNNSNVKKTKSDDGTQDTTAKRGQRQRTKLIPSLVMREIHSHGLDTVQPDNRNLGWDLDLSDRDPVEFGPLLSP